jgi:hypothetical protein
MCGLRLLITFLLYTHSYDDQSMTSREMGIRESTPRTTALMSTMHFSLQDTQATTTPDLLHPSYPQLWRVDIKTEIADLIAQYGSSSSTAWLESQRYHIWRPQEPIPESSFVPVQGYMRNGVSAATIFDKAPSLMSIFLGTRVFAWGNPLVSDPSALAPTAHQFIDWAESRGLIPAWVCVDQDMQQALATALDWSTVTCIYEDVVDPVHIIHMTGPSHKGVAGAHAVKDLKKNLRKAEKAEVDIEEIREFDWTDHERREVEEGINEWKKNKSGLQIASVS